MVLGGRRCPFRFNYEFVREADYGARRKQTPGGLKMQEKLVERAKALLAEGKVRSVIGWRKGLFEDDITPSVFKDAEDLEKNFVFNKYCRANLSKYLVKYTREIEIKKSTTRTNNAMAKQRDPNAQDAPIPEEKVLVFLKPGDSHSFTQLLKENRIARDDVYAVGIPCSCTLDENVKQGEGCDHCRNKKHVVYDEVVGKAREEAFADPARFDGVEKIEKMNVKVQKTEITTSSSSKDLQEVFMSLAVNYRIDNEKAVDLYKTVGTNYTSVILEPAIEESIKAVTSRYTAEELITNRSEVSSKCMEELAKKVEKYGLSVSEFNITNFSFSPEFEKAIEEKQVAEQKVLTAKQELEKDKIEAEKKIVIAEAEKKANELKEKTLTDKIIKEKMIEKWNGELPKVTGSNGIFDFSDILN